MDAALHHCHFDAAYLADDELACVTYGCGARESRNFLIWDFCCAGKLVSKSAETRAKNQCNLGAELCFRKDEFCSTLGPREFTVPRRCRRAGLRHCNMTPTIDADIRLAMVPHSIARSPSRARSVRLFGARAPMPPI